MVETTMENFAQRLQQLETQLCQQRVVVEHQQDQLKHQQTTIDADRAARTPVSPIAQDNQRTFGGSQSGEHATTVHGRNARMERLVIHELEATPLQELPMASLSEAQKKRGRQLAFMLTMHTKDRAPQMFTKLRDPTNGFEIWRRFLDEWEPAHRGRYPAMLLQLLQFL